MCSSRRKSREEPIEGAVAELDQAAGGALGKLAASGELTGKTLEMTLAAFRCRESPRSGCVVGRRGQAREVRHGGIAPTGRRRGALSEGALREAHRFSRARRRTRRRQRRRPSPKACCSAISTAINTERTRKIGPVESAALLGFDASAQSRRRPRAHHWRIAEFHPRIGQ